MRPAQNPSVVGLGGPARPTRLAASAVIALWLWVCLVFAASLEDLRSEPDPAILPAVAQDYRFAGPALRERIERARTRPGAVQVEIIGSSLNDKPIVAFHVAEPGVAVTERVLVFAGIHALEWISTEVALDLLDELMTLPPRGTQVTVIPLLNPDGRARVEHDLLDDRNAYRRGNAIQADLNRDFAHQRQPRAVWRKLLPNYYRTTRDEPFSQPESRALDQLLERERYDRSASLHAFGGYLYHPWAGQWRRPDNHAEYVATGRAMEEAQGAFAYRTRQLARWGFFFRAHGTELDHIHAEYGTQSWLVELTRSGVRPWHPLADYRSYFRWYNPSKPARHRERGVAAMRVLIRGG